MEILIEPKEPIVRKVEIRIGVKADTLNALAAVHAERILPLDLRLDASQLLIKVNETEKGLLAQLKKARLNSQFLLGDPEDLTDPLKGIFFQKLPIGYYIFRESGINLPNIYQINRGFNSITPPFRRIITLQELTLLKSLVRKYPPHIRPFI